MKNLKEFDLRLKESMEYYQENLSEVNELSIAVLKHVDFNQGSFFTLLPPKTDRKKIHDFDSGNILPQNRIENLAVLGKQIRGQIIPTIQEEVSVLIYEKITSSKSLSCIIDDYNSNSKTLNNDELFMACGYAAQEEVYYCLNKNNSSTKRIENCLQRSNTFWHSLGLLTEACFDDFENKKISSAKIYEICLKANLIFVGGYDGEGYIFWKKRR